jgi:hypothetical protein
MATIRAVLPLSMRKANQVRLLARPPNGIFVAARTYSAPPAEWDRRAWYGSVATAHMKRADPGTGSSDALGFETKLPSLALR